jgi:hypothetical protein
VNLTITVVWDDGVTSVLTGLQAGDTVVWHVGPNNESNAVITHGATASGPLDVFIQRTYPLTYLATVASPEVIATFTVSNDSRIVLTDATLINLNQTVPLSIPTTISDDNFGRPAIVVAEQPRQVVEPPRPSTFVESVTNLPPQFNRYQELTIARDSGRQEVAMLFLVHVGPDGKEGQPALLPLKYLRDIPGLLEELKKAKIPNGLYRLYYQEPGLPPQKILEFRKTGDTIGDPVREPGRGTNPIENPPVENGQQVNPPSGNNNQNPMGAVTPAKTPTQEQIDSALAQATSASFTRAARALRRWLRS